MDQDGAGPAVASNREFVRRDQEPAQRGGDRRGAVVADASGPDQRAERLTAHQLHGDGVIRIDALVPQHFRHQLIRGAAEALLQRGPLAFGRKLFFGVRPVYRHQLQRDGLAVRVRRFVNRTELSATDLPGDAVGTERPAEGRSDMRGHRHLLRQERPAGFPDGRQNA